MLLLSVEKQFITSRGSITRGSFTYSKVKEKMISVAVGKRRKMNIMNREDPHLYGQRLKRGKRKINIASN